MDLIRKQNFNLMKGSQYFENEEEIQPSPEPEPKERKFLKKAKKFLPVLLAIFCLALAGIGYYYWREALDLERNPQPGLSQQDTKSLVAAVAQLIVLPEGEEPTIATVTDLEKLKDQPFFANAKIGDKVLIWSQAKKVILYDPVANKIVEVAPLNVSNQ